ncbi:hypothetical protein MEQU1_002632 [Malassezia equina]|uniref:Uncharacterized protein n=1 Tax=Malassezia equina TaxID=1381935 RepID=A0AAF0EE74_9BASI|nr:hypothetical protein MEQU1_002632 [Malassezia equina]
MRVGLVAILLWAFVAYVCATRAPNAEPTLSIDKRQAVGGAALGGGGGDPNDVPTAKLQSISGYDPPPPSTTPTPSNFKSGKILQTNEISGYEDAIRFAKSPATINAISTSLLGFVVAAVSGAVFL